MIRYNKVFSRFWGLHAFPCWKELAQIGSRRRFHKNGKRIKPDVSIRMDCIFLQPRHATPIAKQPLGLCLSASYMK